MIMMKTGNISQHAKNEQKIYISGREKESWK